MSGLFSTDFLAPISCGIDSPRRGLLRRRPESFAGFAAVWIAAVAVAVLLCTSGRAQDAATAPAPAEAPADEIDALRRRVEKLERELQGLRNPAVPAAMPNKVFAVVETPFMGQFSRAGGRSRYLATRLFIVNRSGRDLTLERSNFTLLIDGKPIESQVVPDDMKNYSYRIGGNSFRLGSLPLIDSMHLAANGIGTGWLFVADLPDRPEVPKIVVRVTHDDIQLDVDVNEQRKAALAMSVDRIGPRESLAVIKVAGTLDTINLQSLVDELDRLAIEKLYRVVVLWEPSAPAPEPQLYNWLVQSAMQIGRGVQVSQAFPAINAAIAELHLAGMPSENAPRYRSAPGKDRLHEDPVDAVQAALRTAFKMLPRDELVQEIRTGHRLSRIAALEIGAGRLTEDQLPLVLQMADDADPRVQQAAISALRHFGEPAAVETLSRYALKNVEPLSTVAIDALAGSRYGAAHHALADLIRNEPPEMRRRIMGVLAAHPRPIWSELIYEYARDDPADVDPETLKALVQVGHPELINVLAAAIESHNPDVATEAFRVLARRTDNRSESIALAYALEQLQSEPPDTMTSSLLSRTRDQRAVPLLVKQIEADQPPQNSVELLGRLGDRSVIPALEAAYTKMSDRTKSHVLTALRRLEADSFYDLAAQALATKDSSLISGTAQNLQMDGSVRAIQILATALEKSEHTLAWSYICNALSNLGTPEAVAALTKARDDGDRNKQNYAANALRNIRQRSPGYQYVYRAQSASREEKWEEAIEMYTLAMKIDPELPDAYAGRGNALLKQDKVKQAETDFQQAIELDPFNSVALTSLSICEAMRGELDDAIGRINENRERFKDDGLFGYNAACVFGRAIIWLNENEPESAARATKIGQFTEQALKDLQHSIKHGFRDFDWMQKDPDLDPLHGTDAFAKLIPTDQQDDDAE